MSEQHEFLEATELARRGQNPQGAAVPQAMDGSLKHRTPRESRFEKVLPFGQNPELRERYVNFFGGLRIGKLLEELDLSAGMVSYQHAEGWERGLTIVTAACDRIDLTGPLRSDRDLRLLGSVNWVGRSSMEVGLQLSSWHEERWNPVARAYFIMVSRHGSQAAPVNLLQPETPEEERRFHEGEQRQAQRRALAQQSTHEQPPSAEESQVLHTLFLERSSGETGIPMHETLRQSTLLMHPQSKNIHNKIFGGYLMREAFELAWNITYLHCRRRPQFVSVDHMYFYQPVEIGSVLSFTGQVIYTDRQAMMVEILSEVIQPSTGERQVTNDCFFTFTALDEFGRPASIPAVQPHTYEEGLKYLDGRRRFQLGESIRQSKAGG
ncbi:MAG: hotdog domain-containing protein [bacterium]